MGEITSHRLCLVARVVFQPVALVGSIVGMVGRVTDVEVTQEATILHAQRMQGDGVFEVSVYEGPL